MTSKAKRGKPRRGEGIAKVSAVRIDDETKTILVREFGSLGNALYYIAQGIDEFRALNELPTQGQLDRMAEGKRRRR